MQTTAPAQTHSDQITCCMALSKPGRACIHAHFMQLYTGQHQPASWQGLSLLFIKHTSKMNWSGASENIESKPCCCVCVASKSTAKSAGAFFLLEQYKQLFVPLLHCYGALVFCRQEICSAAPLFNRICIKMNL